MKKILFILTVLFLATDFSLGQGCSDAGFCSMGAMRPSQIYTKKLNFKLRAIEVSYYSGTTTLSPTVNSATLDFTFGIDDLTSFQVKVPYQWVDGNLGNTSGLADLSLSVTRNLKSTEDYHINGTVGFKVPTNNGNLDSEVNSEFLSDNFAGSADLPMYYQTSLGTFDLVLGASWISKDWMFATGLQAPLSHNNQNQFDFDEWQNYVDIEGYLLDHDIATNLKRGVDFMVRAERSFHFSNLDVRLGLLPIFRITKDQIDVDPDPDVDDYQAVDGTTGMALSGLAHVAYHFNTFHSAKLLYGVKITEREVNPDGLTRDSVFQLGYVVRF